MRKNKLRLITYISTLMFLVSGCWDSRDLENLAIPIVVGYDLIFDKAAEDYKVNDKIAVTAVFPLFSPDIISSATVPTNDAKTIGEARTKRAYKTPREVLYGMLQAVVYSEALAEEGLKNHFDIQIRNPQVKLNLLVAISEGSAEDLFNNKIIDYTNSGQYLIDLLHDSNKDCFIPNVTLHRLVSDCHNWDSNPIVPLVKPTENSISLSGMGIFKSDKLIARIGVEEAMILSFLRGEKVQGYLPFLVEDGDDEGSVFLKNYRKIKVSRDGENFIFDIKIRLKGELIEHYNMGSLDNNSDLLKQIQYAVKEDIEKQCNDFIVKMQNEFKIDCIDITRYAAAKWRNELKEPQNDGFTNNAKINVDVDVAIKRKGGIE